MKVYVLATQENFKEAKKLLNGIFNITIVSTPLINYESFKLTDKIEKKIINADVILIMLDEKVMTYVTSNIKFQHALMENGNRNHLVFTVVLGSADIPQILMDTLCIKCDLNSKEEFEHARKKIGIRIENKKIQNREADATQLVHILIIGMIVIALIIKFIEKISGEGVFSHQIKIKLELVAILIAIIVLFVMYIVLMKRKWQKYEKEKTEAYSKRLRQTISSQKSEKQRQQKLKQESEKKELDVIGRMLINLEDIKEFYTWSQKQAKASFILAVSMCLLGFGLIVLAVLLSVISKQQIEVVAISAIGGKIIELVAGTALVVYRNSLAQLNYYHKALHEDERFLSSISLLEKFSTNEIQEDILKEIIKSEIEMNLIEIQNIKETKNARKATEGQVPEK